MTMMNIEPFIEQCESTSQVLKSLAHPQRLQLLCYLVQGEKSVSELEALCSTSQSQLSQFLQRMKSERLIRARREGKFVFYAIEDPKVIKLIQSLRKIFCP